MHTTHQENEPTAATWYGEAAGKNATATEPVTSPVTFRYHCPPFSGPQSRSLKGTHVAGRYRLESVLGTGGFATVYSAYDQMLKRPVAVKVTDAESDMQISADEAHFQAACQHPNVMPLYDAGSDALTGIHYMVMPLYPGADLGAIINRYGPMPFRSAMLCIDQVASALEFLMQRRGATHGDIKPANVFLTPGGSALLMDFNLRGLLARSDGVRGGTPGYTAPEAQIGRITAQSDVFSLACVLYFCLTGVPPFSNDQDARSGKYISVRKFRPEIRPELEAVIQAALSPDLGTRYRSAREFQTALRRPLRGRSFVLLLTITALRAAGRLIYRIHSALWSMLRRGTRHMLHAPKQALTEMLVIMVLTPAFLTFIHGWITAHKSELVITAVCIGLTVCSMAGIHIKRLHKMWRARS